MIHIFWAEQYGVQLAGPRRDEVQLRSVARKLERIIELDPRPLAEAREPDKRLVGNCRDFSLMLTTMLRYQGVPARARCGFARYFIPNHFEDHWVCEYWSTAHNRWVLVDAQLDTLQVGKLGVCFDPLDVPRDEFIVGDKAWQMCRAGQADPDTFGIADLHGLWFVRGNLVTCICLLRGPFPKAIHPACGLLWPGATAGALPTHSTPGQPRPRPPARRWPQSPPAGAAPGSGVAE